MAIAGIQNIAQPAAGLSNLAIISPSTNFGYQAFNPLTGVATGPSWVFNYEGENKAKLEADATDNWLEDNTAVQNHIVVKSEIITVRGFVGEVTVITPPVLALAQQVLTVLGSIGAFQPSYSKTAQLAINQVQQSFNEALLAANSAVSAWNTLSGNGGPNQITANGEIQSPNQNNQQAMFSKIYGYWRNQVNQTTPTLFQIQTPWAAFDECALIGCEVSQGEDTEMMSEFLLTFKMIRLVNDNAQSLASAGRAAVLSSSLVNNGTVVPFQTTDVVTMLQKVL